jgi:hypothetical protein
MRLWDRSPRRAARRSPGPAGTLLLAGVLLLGFTLVLGGCGTPLVGWSDSGGGGTSGDTGGGSGGGPVGGGSGGGPVGGGSGSGSAVGSVPGAAGGNSGPGTSGGGIGGGIGPQPGRSDRADPGGANAPTPDQPVGTLVFPRGGVHDPHPVPVQALARQTSDTHVVIRLDWVSGVEPCNVLARVTVQRTGATFTLSVLEGSLGEQLACPDLAMYKATLVDLGVLDQGTYTVIADPGFAPPLTVSVP